MENIKTMNYQMYADWGDSETFEVSKYDDLETAIEQSIMIEENPSIRLLSLNNGMLASFSRALTEGLSVQQSDDEFNSKLDASIESIYQASIS